MPYESFFFGNMTEDAVYRTRTFNVPFTMQGQPDWKIAGELDEIVGLGKDIHPEDPQHMIRGFVVLGGRTDATPESVVDEMLDTAVFDSITVVGNADVAGYPAIQISSEIRGDGQRFESLAFTSSEFQPFGTFTGVVQRWYVTDVAGRTVIVWIEAPVDQFDEWVLEAEAALATLEFLSE